MFSELVQTHRRLSELAEDLDEVLKRDGPAPIGELAPKRMRLAAGVREYLALEDRLLITPLRSRRTAEADALLAIFDKEMAHLRLNYSKHIADWPSTRIATDWHAYRRAARALASDLGIVISYKNTTLFARAERILR